MKICYKCHALFNAPSIHSNDECPITNCDGIIKKMDDLAIPIYIALHNRNYMVEHIYIPQFSEEPFEIQFEFFDSKNTFDNLPVGFSMTGSKGEICVARKIKDVDLIGKTKEILEAANSVLTWIEGLPERKTLVFRFVFMIKAEAEKLIENMINIGLGYGLQIVEHNEGTFSLAGITYVKSSQTEVEINRLKSLCDKTCVDFFVKETRLSLPKEDIPE